MQIGRLVFLHGRLLEAFGGTPGVRDLGLLECVLPRPRSGYYESLFVQAAALRQSLVQNHAFLDGSRSASKPGFDPAESERSVQVAMPPRFSSRCI